MSSSIAGITAAGSSMPYSVTKAAQLHLMKCLAKTQGPKVRVNAVLPGLLLTEWVCFLSFILDLSCDVCKTKEINVNTGTKISKRDH